MLKNGQTHFKNLASKASGFLNRVSAHFTSLRNERLINITYKLSTCKLIDY